jgi:hypothetical protein
LCFFTVILASYTQAKSAKDIEDARRKVEEVERHYIAVTTLQTSLEKEIGVYRDLLEGKYLDFLCF